MSAVSKWAHKTFSLLSVFEPATALHGRRRGEYSPKKGPLELLKCSMDGNSQYLRNVVLYEPEDVLYGAAVAVNKGWVWRSDRETGNS